MQRSWQSNRVERTDIVDTIADGIAVRVPVPEALDDMREVVDDVFLVDDETILRASIQEIRASSISLMPAGLIDKLSANPLW